MEIDRSRDGDGNGMRSLGESANKIDGVSVSSRSVIDGDGDSFEYDGESFGVLISYKDDTTTPHHSSTREEILNHPIAALSELQFREVETVLYRAASHIEGSRSQRVVYLWLDQNVVGFIDWQSEKKPSLAARSV